MDAATVRHAGATLVVLGAALSAQAILDPPLAGRALPGALLAVGGALAARGSAVVRLGAALAVAWALAAAVDPQYLRADSGAYVAYLRSAAFDRDLDFTNEWAHWGHDAGSVTSTGLRANNQSVGPAILWSPFYLVAHVYVALGPALGGTRNPTDGFSAPYLGATALGTLAVALGGSVLLARTLAARFGPRRAAFAVAATLTGSPVLYYLFVLPAMAHGCAWGVTAVAVWALERVERAPSRRALVLLGAACGLVALVRWQGAVFVLAAAPAVAAGLRGGRLRVRWVLEAGVAALAVFTPQLAAWRVLYGSWLTMPQGGGFIDWSSPRLFDVLLSADHGFLTWTPLMAVGVAGLLASLRGEPARAGGALLVVAATAWINGGVRDWAASDAYGARRFDVVVPLLAWGVAVAFDAGARLAARRPAAVPACVVLALVAWNLGLVRLFETGVFRSAAPLGDLAASQARHGSDLARSAADGFVGAIAGRSGRALVYRMFVGEFLYENVAPGGTIAVGAVHAPLLAEGWSDPKRRGNGPPFRWAYHPQACLRLPLREPVDLAATLTARAPDGLDGQRVAIVVNDTVTTGIPLSREWAELAFAIPARALFSGENRLCLRFASSLPGPEGGRVGAAVSLIQLP